MIVGSMSGSAMSAHSGTYTHLLGVEAVSGGDEAGPDDEGVL